MSLRWLARLVTFNSLRCGLDPGNEGISNDLTFAILAGRKLPISDGPYQSPRQLLQHLASSIAFILPLSNNEATSICLVGPLFANLTCAQMAGGNPECPVGGKKNLVRQFLHELFPAKTVMGTTDISIQILESWLHIMHASWQTFAGTTRMYVCFCHVWNTPSDFKTNRSILSYISNQQPALEVSTGPAINIGRKT